MYSYNHFDKWISRKIICFFFFFKKTEDLIPMIFQIFICIQSMNWKRIYEQPIKVKRWYKMIEIKMCKTLIYHHVKVYIKLPFTPIFILFLICISYFFVLFYVFFTSFFIPCFILFNVNIESIALISVGAEVV